jgi:coenzyme F420-dependent glucose-6-phosphate dehydrogenase
MAEAAQARYYYAGLHEQFPPRELLAQAVAAERSGFDGICCSDHLQPWWEPGHSGHAWVWLGAAMQATERVPLGSAVTPAGPRYHPVLIAQAWATLESMYPNRPFLGFGSGESLNESPLGSRWPPVPDQIARMEEALEIIRALFDGSRVTRHGHFFAADGAFLHTRPERRPPIYVSAFGSEAAAVAARRGDGLWTLADPERAPEIIDAYRSACDDAGHAPGEIVLQAMFSWASEEDEAFEGCRVWKAAQPVEFYRENWHDPRDMASHAEQLISDEELREKITISSDPADHADAVREVEKMGASIVALANVSGADPLGAIATYREYVLPALRGARV